MAAIYCVITSSALKMKIVFIHQADISFSERAWYLDGYVCVRCRLEVCVCVVCVCVTAGTWSHLFEFSLPSVLQLSQGQVSLKVTFTVFIFLRVKLEVCIYLTH